MSISWLGTAGVLMLGTGLLLAWTHHDTAHRLAGPAFRPIDYEVLRVEEQRYATDSQRGTATRWLVHIRFVDPFTGQILDRAGQTSRADAQGYTPGERRRGLYAPQWPRPELTEVAPDVSRDQAFLLWGAWLLVPLGLLVLGFAAATGRLFR